MHDTLKTNSDGLAGVYTGGLVMQQGGTSKMMVSSLVSAALLLASAGMRTAPWDALHVCLGEDIWVITRHHHVSLTILIHHKPRYF